MLKWKADYDGAAHEYSKAATNFKNAKSYPQCKDCLLRASECYKQNRSFFSAAKSIEQAALISKDMGDLIETANLVERACQLFQEHGTPDTAALSLDKGAKIIESKYPERALRLYLKAAEVVLLEDRPRQAAEYLSKAARLQVKLRFLDDAVGTIKREIEMHTTTQNRAAVGRLVVAMVIVHLSRGDYVAADKEFRDGISCVEDDEIYTVETLLEAYDQEDPETAARALNSPFIKHMDVEYAKLARALHVPGSILSEGRTRPEPTASRSLQSPVTDLPPKRIAEPPTSELGNLTLSQKDGERPPPPQSDARPAEDDDDYEGGLC